MINQKCDSCGSEMKKLNKIKSGNSIFTNWSCTKCLNRKTVCEGVAR